jgi:RNA polymerase sigma factor (sigma-70 family)
MTAPPDDRTIPSDDGQPPEARDEHCDELFDKEVAALYERSAGAVRRYVCSLGADHQTAENITQDAFLATRQYWHNARDHAEPYLFTVARNRWHRIARKAGRERPISEENLWTLPDQIVESVEEATIMKLDVWAAIAKLSVRRREAVDLYYFRDFSVEQVAEIMLITPGAVKALLWQARAQLAEMLDGGSAEDRL